MTTLMGGHIMDIGALLKQDIARFLGGVKDLNLKALEFAGLSLKVFIDAVEREAIRNILISSNGSVAEAARKSGYAAATIRARMKNLGLNPDEYRK